MSLIAWMGTVRRAELSLGRMRTLFCIWSSEAVPQNCALVKISCSKAEYSHKAGVIMTRLKLAILLSLFGEDAIWLSKSFGKRTSKEKTLAGIR